MTNYTDGQIVGDTEIRKANVATAMRSFEAWVMGKSWFVATTGLSRCANGIEYNDPLINSRWQGWQACITSRQDTADDDLSTVYMAGLYDGRSKRQAAKVWVVSDADREKAYQAALVVSGEGRPWMSREIINAALASVWPTAGGDGK